MAVDPSSSPTRASDEPSGPASACPGEELLFSFATGALHGDALQAAERHVSDCDDCLLLLTATLYGLEQSTPSEPEPEREHAGAQPSERFELGELLAEGGMGRVYAGRDRQTGQQVALKCLSAAHASQHPESQQRFLREAEILGKLDHPNVVRRIALVELGQRWHIVMEYVPGGSLRDALKATPRLPLQQVLRLGMEVADALARAHHLGIVHRDLKPENILLAADGTPRLSDFGLARGLEPSITRSGVLLGTLAYVSPEALSDGEVDARADLWALGVILFEMLTGERPFHGRNTSTVLNAILHRPPPLLAELCPEVPAALVELLQRLLQKDPAQRVRSARQVGAELEAIARELDTPRPAALPRTPESVAAGPLAAGPLAAGPLAAGPLAAGPLAAGPLATEPERTHPLGRAARPAVLSSAELALRSSSHLRRVADRC